jgi:hypothetical protein
VRRFETKPINTLPVPPSLLPHADPLSLSFIAVLSSSPSFPFALLPLMTRTKLTRHTAPESNVAMEPTEVSGWERSKITKQEQKLLKTLGLGIKEKSMIFPGDESFPRPPINYRVTFADHLIRGISTPIHNFLRGLLFV